jgi:hypothetical protein
MDGVETRKVELTLSPTTILQLSVMQIIECADLSTGFENFMTFWYAPCSCSFYPEDGQDLPKPVGDHRVIELHS